jgi:hypothetical protein
LGIGSRDFPVAALTIVKRAFRVTGFTASLLAILVASGGHWMVLQSVAWTRMLIVNAQSETLTVAVGKTFDGKHPCKMCHQIRDGREQERHASAVVSHDHGPRMWLAVSVVSLDPAIPRDQAIEVWASRSPADFVGSPPEPPPRAA